MKTGVRILAALNRPLPAWLTLLLFLGAGSAIAAGPMVVHDGLVVLGRGSANTLTAAIEVGSTDTTHPDTADVMGSLSFTGGVLRGGDKTLAEVDGGSAGHTGGYILLRTKADGSEKRQEVLYRRSAGAHHASGRGLLLGNPYTGKVRSE